MDNEPDNKPSRTTPKVVAFLFAGIGLFLLNGRADSLSPRKAGMLAWRLIIAGAAFLILSTPSFLAFLRGKSAPN
jgi:hypothetical protein